MFTLDQILGLVGTLDDAPGDDTPRERFRGFLRDSVGAIGAVRDYVEACTKNKGPQYDHALQDLVNHTGALIGFDVEYGRYKGVANDIGHDGLWRWNDFSIVVEVKTTDAFAIRTETLVGYVNKLISAGRVADWDHAVGLYVFARSDAERRSLANSIVAEKRTHELRIATVDTVLSLAELVQEKHITPDEAVALLRPAGVFVADTVKLLARIAAQATIAEIADSVNESTAVSPIVGESPAGPTYSTTATVPPRPTSKLESAAAPSTERIYLMTPVRDEEEQSAKDTIETFLTAGWYVFGDRTPGRRLLKPGARLCFYETGVGVIAEAEVASVPKREPPDVEGIVKSLEQFPWSFRLKNARLFFDKPVVIDADLRARLDAFKGRDLTRSWAWFVQSTGKISERDFAILTGKSTVDQLTQRRRKERTRVQDR